MVAKHFRPLTIAEVKNETAECVSLSFLVPAEWREEFTFKAGQNVTLRSHIDGEEIRRSYSICSSPQDHILRIAIKKLAGGKFSSHAHQHFKKGEILDVMAPTGNFYLSLQANQKKHYVAFAAGSGITPVISILKTILKEEPLSRFTLVFGNQTRASVIFREELLDIKNNYPERFQLIAIFSREKMDAPLFEGRIDAAKCETIFKQIVPMADDQEYLLCGPSEMIFTVRDYLKMRKVEENNIHYELFSDPGEATPYTKKTATEKQDNSQKKSSVTIRLDGISTQFQIPYDGPTILEAALQSGADLPYACRAGVCATCRAKLVKGKIRMDQNYSLAEEEIEQGFILACQAHPESDKIVVDFDIR